MMLVEPAARRAARQHWWKVVLALSLALNLFFLIGAAWIRIHGPASVRVLSPEDRLVQMAGELNLNPQQRQAFTQYSHTMRSLFDGMHKAVGPLMSKAWSEMAKPQADEGKIIQLFDEAAQQRRVVARDITTTTLSFLATLSPQQRAQFIKLAHQRPRPWSPSPQHDGGR